MHERDAEISDIERYVKLSFVRVFAKSYKPAPAILTGIHRLQRKGIVESTIKVSSDCRRGHAHVDGTHLTASGPPGRSLKMKTFNSVLSSAVVILSIVSSNVARSSESL